MRIGNALSIGAGQLGTHKMEIGRRESELPLINYATVCERQKPESS